MANVRPASPEDMRPASPSPPPESKEAGGVTAVVPTTTNSKQAAHEEDEIDGRSDAAVVDVGRDGGDDDGRATSWQTAQELFAAGRARVSKLAANRIDHFLNVEGGRTADFTAEQRALLVELATEMLEDAQVPTSCEIKDNPPDAHIPGYYNYRPGNAVLLWPAEAESRVDGVIRLQDREIGCESCLRRRRRCDLVLSKYLYGFFLSLIAVGGLTLPIWMPFSVMEYTGFFAGASTAGDGTGVGSFVVNSPSNGTNSTTASAPGQSSAAPWASAWGTTCLVWDGVMSCAFIVYVPLHLSTKAHLGMVRRVAEENWPKLLFTLGNGVVYVVLAAAMLPHWTHVLHLVAWKIFFVLYILFWDAFMVTTLLRAARDSTSLLNPIYVKSEDHDYAGRRWRQCRKRLPVLTLGFLFVAYAFLDAFRHVAMTISPDARNDTIVIRLPSSVSNRTFTNGEFVGSFMWSNFAFTLVVMLDFFRFTWLGDRQQTSLLRTPYEIRRLENPFNKEFHCGPRKLE